VPTDHRRQKRPAASADAAPFGPYHLGSVKK
jgi:hypothetical protein